MRSEYPESMPQFRDEKPEATRSARPEFLRRPMDESAPSVRHFMTPDELIAPNGESAEATFSGTPFADTLKPTGFDSRTVAIRSLDSRPDKLVREHLLLEDQNLNDVAKSAVEGKELFARLADKYGVRIVSMDSVIGKNEEGKLTLFTVVDKVDGESLEKAKELPAESKEELEGLFLSLGKQYFDAWKNNEPYWADFQSDQFMYGKKQGEEDKHFYLVDIGAQFYLPGQSRRNPETNEELHPLEWMLRNACEGLVESEGKFQPRTRFARARQQLLEDVDKMLAEKPDDKWLLEAKSALTN